MKKSIIYQIVLALIFSLITTAVLAADRYVATTGSDDGNNCADIGNPCLTITNAYNYTGPGDTINIAAGEYTIASQLDIKRTVKLRGNSKNNTIVNVQGAHGIQIWSINTPEPVLIENLDIRGSGTSAATFAQNSYVVIKDTKYTNTQGAGIMIEGGKTYILNSTIYDTGRDGISIIGSGNTNETKAIFINNTIAATNWNGINIGNTVQNTIVTIAKNIFVNNNGNSIWTEMNSQQAGVRFFGSLLVYNNTFIGNKSFMIKPDNGLGIYKNNLFAYNRASIFQDTKLLSLGEQYRSHNLEHANDTVMLNADQGAVVNDPKFIFSHEGTSTGRTENTLTDTSQNWPVNSLAGKFINPNYQPGTFRIWYYIISNTNDTITVADGDMTSWANPGNPYKIMDAKTLDVTSPAINAGHPDSSWNNADASRNTIGASGGPEQAVPFVTFRTPKNYTSLTNTGMTMNDLLINNDNTSNITEFEWQQKSGTVVELDSNLIEKPHFTSPNQIDKLAFNVKVTDSNGNEFGSHDTINYYTNNGVQINGVGPRIATIQQAINLAQNGDEILVNQGTYFETGLYINKNIILVGISPEDTQINGLDAVSVMHSGPEQAGMQVTANNFVLIKNLSIRNMSGPGIHLNPAIEFSPDFTLAKAVLFQNKAGIIGSTNGEIKIIDSDIINNTFNGIAARGNTKLEIRQNKIVGNGGEAISYPDGPVSKVAVVQNVIANNESTGLNNKPVSIFASNIVINPKNLLNFTPIPETGLLIKNNTFYSMDTNPGTMYLFAPEGLTTKFINNAVIENPNETALTCHNTGSYELKNNLFFHTDNNFSPECPPGSNNKINTLPQFAIEYEDTIDLVLNKGIKINEANWTPNEFADRFLIIKDDNSPKTKAYYIFSNTTDTINVAIPKGKEVEYDLLAEGFGQNDTIEITRFRFNKNSPLYNAGINTPKPTKSIEGISRLSFGVADIGAIELPEFTLFSDNQGKSINIIEGNNKTIKINLLNPTSDNVNVTVSGPDKLILSPDHFTFTPNAFDTPQNLNVTVKDDALKQGNYSEKISFTLVSDNLEYNNKDVPDINFNITDDESIEQKQEETDEEQDQQTPPLVIIQQSDGSTVVSRDGLTDNYTMKLGKRPDTAVKIKPKPSPALEVSTNELTFNLYNWNKPQAITVSARKIPDYSDDTQPEKNNHFIDHEVTSTTQEFNNYVVPKLPVTINNYQSGDTQGDEAQDKFNIHVHDGQVTESTHNKIIAIVDGILDAPEFTWSLESGPTVTIEEPELINYGNKLKVVSEIVAPKYNPKNSRAYIKLTVKDTDLTKSATMKLAILPKEKELTKQDVEKTPGKIIGASPDGAPIKLTQEPGNGTTEYVIWLSKTIKLYIPETSYPQTITIGDYVVFSDYTYRNYRGAIVAFHIPSLKRTEYILHDVMANQLYGEKSYVGPYDNAKAGYVLDKGDVNGDGQDEAWIFLPLLNNNAGIYVFDVSNLNTLIRFIESPQNIFSKLFNVADINGDGLADLGIGTILSSSSHIKPDDIDDEGEYAAADQIMTYLTQASMDSLTDLASVAADYEIKPHRGTGTSAVIKMAVSDDAVIEFSEDLDFNNDGADDIVTIDSTLMLDFSFGTSEDLEELLSMSVDISSLTDSVLSSSVGDVTGDGISDLVLGCPDGLVLILAGNSAYPEELTLSEDDIITLYIDDSIDIDQIIVGDVNGDGIDDISVYDGTNDTSTIIDTYDSLGGNNTKQTVTSNGFTGELGGAAGCSLNTSTLKQIEANQNYLTALFLILVLAIVRKKNSFPTPD